jgi:hypothetical protein
MPAIAHRDSSRGLPVRNERPRRFQHLEARQMFEPGARTLDERISSTWSTLVSEGAADCPVCSSRMLAAHQCGTCGSELS